MKRNVDSLSKMSEEIQPIPFSKLEISPFCIRKRYPVRSLQYLKRSIAELGILMPLIVRKVNDKYEVVCGKRRYLAVKELNEDGADLITELPCIARKLTDTDVKVLSMVDDCLHDNCDMRDKGEQTVELFRDFKSLREISDRVGWDEQVLEGWMSSLSQNLGPRETKEKMYALESYREGNTRELQWRPKLPDYLFGPLFEYAKEHGAKTMKEKREVIVEYIAKQLEKGLTEDHYYSPAHPNKKQAKRDCG